MSLTDRFKNVNEQKFVNITSNLKSKVNYSTLEEIISTIDNTSIWDSSAKKNLRGNLSMMMIEYKKLSSNINYLYDVALKVKEYNELATEVENLLAQKKRLESSKWIYTYINGIQHKSVNPETQKEINRLKIEISKKKSELRAIHQKIRTSQSYMK